jgi:hypothetical protein
LEEFDVSLTLLQRSLPEYFGEGLFEAPKRVAHNGDVHFANGTLRTHAHLSVLVKGKVSAALSNDIALYRLAKNLLHRRLKGAAGG